MANKKMEDFFNLPPTVEDVDGTLQEDAVRDELIANTTAMYSALTMAEKINFSLPTVVGLDTHELEMDTISKKAETTYSDLIALGANVPDAFAGKIYEVAAQFLKTSLDAKIAKADKKIRMIELQLKKVRLEQIDVTLGTAPSPNNGGADFDRNELLKYMVNPALAPKASAKDK